jgi:hypothetical protein
MTLEEEAERLKKLVDQINDIARTAAKRRSRTGEGVEYKFSIARGTIVSPFLWPDTPYEGVAVKITKDL